jgi:uncharacterized protein YsxB (DUF464 family)
VSITATVSFDRASFVRALAVTGHAGAGPRGHDIVCAAVSVLVRTAAAVLSDREYVTADVVAPARGEVYLTIAYKREGEPYLGAVQDFLLTGLESLRDEYPACLTLVYEGPRDPAL